MHGRNQEAQCLTLSCRCDCHHVLLFNSYGNGLHLNRLRLLKLKLSKVPDEVWVEVGVFLPSPEWSGDPSSLDEYFVIFPKNPPISFSHLLIWFLFIALPQFQIIFGQIFFLILFEWLLSELVQHSARSILFFIPLKYQFLFVVFIVSAGLHRLQKSQIFVLNFLPLTSL